MATIEEKKLARESFQESLEAILAFKDEDLLRIEDLGTQVNFASGEEAFKRLLLLYEDLSACPIDVLSFGQLNIAKIQADAAAAILQRVIDYKHDEGSPVRDKIVLEATNAYDTHLDKLALIIAYAYAKGTDLRALEREVRDTANNMKGAADDAKKLADDRLREVEDVLEKVRQAAAKQGVAHHATNFAEEAKTHGEATTKWLWATVALSAVGVLVLLLLFVGRWAIDPAGLTSGQAIYSVATRVLIFSIVSYAILWCGRNYMAHRHNAVVNKHRQNALTTFETFVKGAGDDAQVKNAVLLQASHCVFMPQPSGYLSREPHPTPPRNFVEVIQKSVAPAKDVLGDS